MMASRTYIEVFNMLTQGGATVTPLVAPLVCDDMRANMAVTSAYKLSKLGVGHFHSPTDSEEQSLIVAVEPKKFEHVPLHTQRNGLPYFELISTSKVEEMIASPGSQIKRLNPDGSPFCMVHAMQQLKDHWNRAAQASPHHAQYAQISSMCDEYHFALTTSPKMPIVISSHDDYKAYDDPNDPTDMPSELNNDHSTVPSPTALRKSESTHAGAVTVHPHSAESMRNDNGAILWSAARQKWTVA